MADDCNSCQSILVKKCTKPVTGSKVITSFVMPLNILYILFLNSFFGEDPPLLAIFLKKLGYEVGRIIGTCYAE